MILGKQIAHCAFDGFGPFARIGVTIGVQNDDQLSIGKPVTFEKIDVAESFTPTVSLQREAAQQLMDELWRIGLRPSEGSGSAGAMAATERHLADMRAIAFDRLKIAAEKQGK